MKNTRYRIYPMKSLILFVLCWKAATGLSVSGGQPQHPSTRRKVLALLAPSVAFGPLTANAYNTKRSRSDGYTVQRKDSEWRSILSPTQYFILREGGTERPYSSILESEERSGAYKCAGCGTELFESTQKFHSGTGWPSFAMGLPGVEIDQVGAIQERLLGAELRCKTCGGHLGDVFNDGYLFVGTPAFVTGKRFCIDGAALVFHPKDGTPDLRGDTPAPMPDWMRSPEIKPSSLKA